MCVCVEKNVSFQGLLEAANVDGFTLNSFSSVMVACGHCIQLADSTKLVTLQFGARQGAIPSSCSLFLIVYAAQKASASSCVLNQSDLSCEDCSLTAAMRNKQ